MIGHLEATARNVMELTRNPVQWLHRLDSPVFPDFSLVPAVEINRISQGKLINSERWAD